jgi:hypothetical protein
MQIFKVNQKNLQLEEVKKSKYVLMGSGISLAILLLPILIFFLNRKPEPKQSETIPVSSIEKNHQIIFINNDKEKFSEEKLKQLLINLNVKFPDIAFAQARYESGNFGKNKNANLFYSNHNLFGMRVAMSRPTTNIGEENNFAIYENWVMSVIDYAFWQISMTKEIHSRSEYLSYLKAVYSEGTYSAIETIMRDSQKEYPELFVNKHPAQEKKVFIRYEAKSKK